MAAIIGGHLECTKVLLIAKSQETIEADSKDDGVAIDNHPSRYCNSINDKIIVLASQTPNVEILKIIVSISIAKGDEIDLESPSDKLTMFMRAVLTQNTKNAKFLKKKGASVNHRNSDNETILHIALREKLPKVVAL